MIKQDILPWIWSISNNFSVNRLAYTTLTLSELGFLIGDPNFALSEVELDPTDKNTFKQTNGQTDGHRGKQKKRKTCMTDRHTDRHTNK